MLANTIVGEMECSEVVCEYEWLKSKPTYGLLQLLLANYGYTIVNSYQILHKYQEREEGSTMSSGWIQCFNKAQ